MLKIDLFGSLRFSPSIEFLSPRISSYLMRTGLIRNDLLRDNRSKAARLLRQRTGDVSRCCDHAMKRIAPNPGLAGGIVSMWLATLFAADQLDYRAF